MRHIREGRASSVIHDATEKAIIRRSYRQRYISLAHLKKGTKTFAHVAEQRAGGPAPHVASAQQFALIRSSFAKVALLW